jgi:Zn-dependent protease with chaperone function
VSSDAAIARYGAQWFDGVTAQVREAVLVVDREALQVRAADRMADYPLAGIRPSVPVAGVPMRLALPDGGVLVVGGNADALGRLLAPPRQDLAHRLEHNLVMVALALAGVAATAFFGWRDGVPWLAARVATRIPLSAEANLGAATLATLDTLAFQPTRLPEAVQAEVRAAFGRLADAAALPQAPTLAFRLGRTIIGANALALPGGTVVITDQLVLAMDSVEATAAVLAHEIGHEARRHAMQELLASSAAALVFGTLLGDVSGVGSLAATAPGTFLRLHFSRGAEDEADRYAYDLLRRTGSSPARLGTALEALERTLCRSGESDRDEDEGDDAASTAGQDGSASGAKGGCEGSEDEPSYLSTHPGLRERIEHARAAARQ